MDKEKEIQAIQEEIKVKEAKIKELRSDIKLLKKDIENLENKNKVEKFDKLEKVLQEQGISFDEFIRRMRGV